MITIEEALNLVDNTIKPERLNSVQELLLTQCWQGKTYQDIANDSGYDPDYIRVVGSRLWQILSQSFGEKITKNNFKSILRQQFSRTEINHGVKGYIAALDLPDSPVPLESSLYIQRPPIEAQAYEEVLKPGALIRIKAPKQMGKTSLTMRILAIAQSRGYYTVRLNFLQAENSVLSSLERLLRWFCANITLQLGIESILDDYWDEDLGIKVSCTNYLQGYILGQLDSPLIIALDEVNRLFSYPLIAQEFLPLLRFWHEEANNLVIWQKFRLIVTYSTEVYIPLNIHQSPFNVGLSLKLVEFNWEQIQQLAQRYGLDKNDEAIEPQQLQSLQQIVGGHPYLLNLAFCHLVTGDTKIEQLIEEAPTEAGIYRDHLRGHLSVLSEYPDLAAAYQQVVTSSDSVEMNSIIAYKLESAGLVKLQGNKTIPMCELYRLYFCDRL
jgi:hypothetical protein